MAMKEKKKVLHCLLVLVGRDENKVLLLVVATADTSHESSQTEKLVS